MIYIDRYIIYTDSMLIASRVAATLNRRLEAGKKVEPKGSVTIFLLFRIRYEIRPEA